MELATFVVAAIAGAIAAVSGFGIGSLLTPFFMIELPAQHAVAAVAVPHVVATSIRWWSLRADVDLPTFRQFGLASAAGGLAGAALQATLANPALTVVLAALLVVAGGGELAGRRLRLPPTRGWRLAGGALSGVFGGLVGNQGGIRAAALAGFRLPPRPLVATATASALLVDAARLPVYAVTTGAAMIETAPLWLVATAGVTLGTFIGVPLLRRLPDRAYQRLLGVLLVGLGVVLVIRL